jgi:hypothetical protein
MGCQPALKGFIDELLERDASLASLSLGALHEVGIQLDCLCLRRDHARIVLSGASASRGLLGSHPLRRRLLRLEPGAHAEGLGELGDFGA